MGIVRNVNDVEVGLDAGLRLFSRYSPLVPAVAELSALQLPLTTTAREAVSIRTVATETGEASVLTDRRGKVGEVRRVTSDPAFPPQPKWDGRLRGVHQRPGGWDDGGVCPISLPSLPSPSIPLTLLAPLTPLAPLAPLAPSPSHPSHPPHPASLSQGMG